MESFTVKNNDSVAKERISALREAAKAIAEVARRDRDAPVDATELRARNADLLPVIEQGADALIHDHIERTRGGQLVIRRGVHPFLEDGPRARLYHRLRHEALKAAGICDEC